MRASELIEELKDALKKHGDLPVRYCDYSSRSADVDSVYGFNVDGEEEGDIVEIFLI